MRGLQLLVCGRGCFHRDLGLVLQTARSPEKQLLLMVNYILIANSASHYFTLQVLNSKPMFTPTKLLSRLHVDTWLAAVSCANPCARDVGWAARWSCLLHVFLWVPQLSGVFGVGGLGWWTCDPSHILW